MSFGISGFGGLSGNDMVKSLTGQGGPKKLEKAKEKEADAGLLAKKNDPALRASSADSKVKLSDRAQKVLDELKEKYGNTDFYVADFKSEEEAGQILANSTKDYGVVIKPEELEKMAEDAEYKDKIFQTISDAQSTLDEFRENLSEEEKGSVKRVGFSIGDDGKVSYFAELEKAGKAQSERIKKQREEKAEEAKAEEKKAEKAKEKEPPTVRSYVKAESMDELGAKLREFLEKDESAIAAEAPRIDFSA